MLRGMRNRTRFYCMQPDKDGYGEVVRLAYCCFKALPSRALRKIERLKNVQYAPVRRAGIRTRILPL